MGLTHILSRLLLFRSLASLSLGTDLSYKCPVEVCSRHVKRKTVPRRAEYGIRRVVMEPESPRTFQDRDVEATDAVRDAPLAGRVQSSLRRSSSLSARSLPSVSRKTGFRRHINVEALPGHLQASVLWASDRVAGHTDEAFPYVPTETVHVDPRDDSRYSPSDFVRQTDPFDIRVEGMYTEAFDPQLPIVGRRNELVLYSLEAEEDPTNTKKKDNPSVPKIHYNHTYSPPEPESQRPLLSTPGTAIPEDLTGREDPFVYTNDSAVLPDQYVAIPDSKSLVLCSPGGDSRRRVNLRFKIMEMDSVDSSVREAIEGISQLSSHLNSITVSMPFVTVLSPAIGMAGEVGRRALDSYAKPDSVISIDFNMRTLPHRDEDLHNCRPGDYLRYGYLFFLSRPVRARLYASTSTSRQVRLMMRVTDSRRSLYGSKPQYQELTKVSYLVVRVGVPFGDEDDSDNTQKPKLSVGAVRRLQSIVESAEDLPANEVKDDIVNLMNEVRGSRI